MIRASTPFSLVGLIRPALYANEPKVLSPGKPSLVLTRRILTHDALSHMVPAQPQGEPWFTREEQHHERDAEHREVPDGEAGRYPDRRWPDLGRHGHRPWQDGPREH